MLAFGAADRSAGGMGRGSPAMPGLAHGSVLISLVAMLFAAVLVATPTLAVLTHPQERPVETPRPVLMQPALA